MLVPARMCISDMLNHPTSNVKLATESTPLDVIVSQSGPPLGCLGWVTEFTLCHVAYACCVAQHWLPTDASNLCNYL